MDILITIRNYFIYFIAALTLIFSPSAISTETAKLTGTDTFVMENALVMGQGITTDGEYYYTSGTITSVDITAIAKIDIDTLKVVDKNINPLPAVCKNRGNNHIGGISWYDGKIYAPVEGGDEVTACIAVFDAETLDFTGEVYDLPAADFSTGVPWCAVDGETGYLYASVWEQTDKIHVYDVNNSMQYVKTISLSAPVKRIQGGEFLDGTLYLSKDNNDKDKIRDILSVNVSTGEVTVAAERNVGGENIEAEGMTFTEGENGPVLHVLDYNKNIGIFLHHYSVDF